MTLVEICTPSYTSALQAQKGGADRIELCQNLETGGITPSPAVLTLCREAITIPIAVLIRPRGGDFVYSAEEQLVMQRDILFCRELGMEAVVVGGLTNQGALDESLCRRFLDWAYPMDVTFHRAMDKCSDPLAALDQLISWGYQRVLTSGQAPQAPAGEQMITTMMQQAAGRITIMPGGGLTLQNIAGLVHRTQAKEVHLSAKKIIHSAFANSASVALAAPGLAENDYLETDAETVRQIKLILAES